MVIDNYDFNTLQTFLSLLNQLESDGISDVRFARESIQRKIDEQHVQIKSQIRISNKSLKQAAKSAPLCPSCGKTRLQPVYLDNDSSVNVIGCRLCRYSEVV